MDPCVSIIVPVYNAEASLRRCVESVLNQEFTDFELILANDGSRDGSGGICDAFAAADSRVRVIHKENTGVSDTRNQAISQARGRYLQFLDSDDWITPNATKLLVRAAESRGCDMVVADFYRVVGERVSHKGDIDEDTVLTREEYAAHMMENPADFYYGVLWNKLYRRELVEAHHLRMDPDISWCEDFMFNLEYIRHAQTFFALQVPVYYYVRTKGSLASQALSISKTVRMKLTVFEYYNQFYKAVLDEEEYEKSRLKVYRFLFDAAQDGAALPLPGSTRLGEERTHVHAGALEGRGLFYDLFREKKLLDYCLEPAALKSGLSLRDAGLLLCLRQAASGPGSSSTRRTCPGRPRWPPPWSACPCRCARSHPPASGPSPGPPAWRPRCCRWRSGPMSAPRARLFSLAVASRRFSSRLIKVAPPREGTVPTVPFDGGIVNRAGRGKRPAPIVISMPGAFDTHQTV